MADNKVSLHDQLIDSVITRLNESGVTSVFNDTMFYYQLKLYDAANKGQLHYQLNLIDFQNQLAKKLNEFQMCIPDDKQTIQASPDSRDDNVISLADLPLREFVISYVIGIWHLDIENTADEDTVDIHWNIPADRFVDKLDKTKKN